MRRFFTRPIVVFLTVSVVLHLALLFALPLKMSVRSHVRQRYFDVDLVKPPPPRIKSVSPLKKFSQPVKPKKKSRQNMKQFKSAKKRSSSATVVQTEKEATVSLFADDNQYGSYLAHVRFKIDSVWQYPPTARERGIQGTLTLRFSIARTGRLADIKLIDSSGKSLLDSEALRTIHEAAPFSAFPKDFSIAKLNILATFAYQFGKD